MYFSWRSQVDVLGRWGGLDERRLAVEITKEVIQLSINLQIHVHGDVDGLYFMLCSDLMGGGDASGERQSKKDKRNYPTHWRDYCPAAYVSQAGQRCCGRCEEEILWVDSFFN